MISKILLPTDGSGVSQKAASYAVDLAKQINASVIIISVVDTSSLLAQTIPASADYLRITEPIENYMREAAKKYIRSIKALCDKKGVKSREVIASGHPADEILKEAKKSKASLIIIGSHGRSALKAAVLGSVTYRVIHKDIKIPVLVVKG